ncbi:MAG: SDR family oxidoreductase [Gemmatimonadetes bacterium]|nr:SDR family oxidoreductase [Gemmatimonadota bacterium]MBT6150284.1 SDR family oxidoreductase [Gemmatimonadota bacterium]MBT7862753.1 SDR family oxidoreductase [Gemmatimonadota bacterium]
MGNVLIGGSTGYLGGFVLREAKRRGHRVRALTRSKQKLLHVESEIDEVVVGQITEPDSLRGISEGMDVVISSIGITRQKDGLTYEDVDFQANLNLLNEALASGVRKFVYVSLLHADQMRDLKIVEAKERFVEILRDSGVSYTVIRPNGFFSDMRAFSDMAKRGRVYLFGRGDFQINPISGRDVAARCLDAIDLDVEELSFGGPETFTHREIAEEAFSALGMDAKITCVPVSIGRAVLSTLRVITPVHIYGPVEFTVTVITRDMVGPPCGTDRLGDYFRSEVDQQQLQ